MKGKYQTCKFLYYWFSSALFAKYVCNQSRCFTKGNKTKQPVLIGFQSIISMFCLKVRGKPDTWEMELICLNQLIHSKILVWPLSYWHDDDDVTNKYNVHCVLHIRYLIWRLDDFLFKNYSLKVIHLWSTVSNTVSPEFPFLISR